MVTVAKRRKATKPTPSSSPCGRLEDEALTSQAWTWFWRQLKKVGWVEFTPAEKYCVNLGFVPVQYKEAYERSLPNAALGGSKKSFNSKTFANFVMENGKRGVHYALGWMELYALVKKFGELDAYNIIQEYVGPPLLGTTAHGTGEEWPQDNNDGASVANLGVEAAETTCMEASKTWKPSSSGQAVQRGRGGRSHIPPRVRRSSTEVNGGKVSSYTKQKLNETVGVDTTTIAMFEEYVQSLDFESTRNLFLSKFGEMSMEILDDLLDHTKKRRVQLRNNKRKTQSP